jgi:2-keto-3-deoxy-L-rhamnonate aldolase RhmA
VPACAYHLIAPVLDAGALGIMAPLIETREQAETLVAACRYRPQGQRGLGFSISHDRYTGGSARAKMQSANEAILTIALIESARGVENAESILATPGLDLGWLGHYDLSDSLGCAERFTDARFLAAERRLLEAAHVAGRPMGFVAPTGEAAQLALRRGFRCICIGHEVAVLRNALMQEFAKARKGGPDTP